MLNWNFKVIKKKKSTIHCTLYGFVYDSDKISVQRLEKYQTYKRLYI